MGFFFPFFKITVKQTRDPYSQQCFLRNNTDKYDNLKPVTVEWKFATKTLFVLDVGVWALQQQTVCESSDMIGKKNWNCRDSCWSSSSASRTKSKHNRRAFGSLYGEEVQENTHRWQHTKGNESAQSRRCEKEWDKKLAICEAGSTFHYPHSHRLSRHLGVPVHCPLHKCRKLSRVAYNCEKPCNVAIMWRTHCCRRHEQCWRENPHTDEA